MENSPLRQFPACRPFPTIAPLLPVPPCRRSQLRAPVSPAPITTPSQSMQKSCIQDCRGLGNGNILPARYRAEGGLREDIVGRYKPPQLDHRRATPLLFFPSLAIILNENFLSFCRSFSRWRENPSRAFPEAAYNFQTERAASRCKDLLAL